MLFVKKSFYFEFAEENPQGDPARDKDQNPSAGTKNTENKDGQGQQEHMIPKSRFDEINTKYKELQGKLD